MQKTRNILLVVFGIAAVIAGIYMLVSDNSNQANIVDIPEEWEQYSTTTLSIYHPPEAQIQEEAGATKIQVLGPDTIENSEVTDGFTFFVQTEDIPEDSTLGDLAQQRYETVTEHINGIDEPTQRLIGNNPAYSYTIESQVGEDGTGVLISAGDNKAFIISYNVSDPNNVGYEDTIETMMKTLELNN